MKKRLFAVMIAIFMGLAAGSAWANIQSEIEMQQEQIHRGIRSGRLSRGEADILRDNLRHIRNEFDRARRDGRISSHERDRLERMLEHNERMIRRMKHNDVRRFN